MLTAFSRGFFSMINPHVSIFPEMFIFLDKVMI